MAQSPGRSRETGSSPGDGLKRVHQKGDEPGQQPGAHKGRKPPGPAAVKRMGEKHPYAAGGHITAQKAIRRAMLLNMRILLSGIEIVGGCVRVRLFSDTAIMLPGAEDGNRMS